jgi:outer membrane protein OmpA-like peptidoglycan-associated protein
MMRQIITLLVLILSFNSLNGQVDLNGVWQGIMIKTGAKIEEGTILFTSFTISDKNLEGHTRDEIYNTDFFAVKKIRGSVKGNTIRFSQIAIEKNKKAPKTNWCNIDALLTYNDTTGYLEGTYTSLECKNTSGKIILFKTNTVFSTTEESPLSHTWFKRFQNDLKKGYKAPVIRDKERKEFVFQPIYFDYDKTEIKPEYQAFLKKMIRVVDGHSDLRIKVTGHTDADGSDAYNLDLSKRRAEALIQFFIANGLSRDRIEIDFKGEAAPIDNNTTPEGKQRNRRVDFSFI